MLFDNLYIKRNILVTGHTGFKGAWLSLWLNHLGADVVGYSLKPPTQPNLFDLCNLQTRLVSIEGDIRDFDHLKQVIKTYRPEIIFHMAAQSLVRRSYQDPIETYSTNVMGTVHLLEAVRQVGSVKVVVNITSDKCYENKEWVWGYRETDPLGGYDPYSSSKGCAELVTNAYVKSYFNPNKYEKHGVAIASVRAGNVIGGGDWAENRLIPDCIKALWENKPLVVRNPYAIRPWQHVLEPLSGYLLLAQRLYQDGSAFVGGWNFGPNDEDARPVIWVVKKIAELWENNVCWVTNQVEHSLPGEYSHEARYLKLDCSKAKSILGWFPQWDLKLALEKTIDWYKAYFNQEDILKVSMEQIQSFEECLQQREK